VWVGVGAAEQEAGPVEGADCLVIGDACALFGLRESAMGEL
jgi:hypothetical protein